MLNKIVLTIYTVILAAGALGWIDFGVGDWILVALLVYVIAMAVALKEFGDQTEKLIIEQEQEWGY